MRESSRRRKQNVFDISDLNTRRRDWRHFIRWAKQRLNARSVFFLICAITLLVYSIVVVKEKIRRALRWVDPPPLYERYHRAELALPQHDTEHAFSQGQKYLWVNNHVSALGWGNYLEDLIMNAQIAYSSGRAFVFDNYTWNRDNTEYSEYSGKLIPSQIPLSALISGPLVGGPFTEGDRTPLAVHKLYFDKICPNPTIIDTTPVREAINDENASALTILNAWVDYLRSIADPCVEISRYSSRIFDYYIYGQKERMLSISPVLSRSPILTLFGWSPLVQAAFDINRALFSAIPIMESYTSNQDFMRCSDPYTPLPGLLVLHIRRGDFVEHCEHLARWSSSFNAFNAYETLPDQWVTPSGGGNGETSPENMKLYMRRCFPTIPQIVEKIQQVRQTPAGKGLKDIYVMTNGKKGWVGKLKRALSATGGWEKIATSRDIVLTKEQKYIAQSVDMLIGQRAQVLIGNGFSSLTSDIVMMRMARNLAPSSNRFW